MSDEKHPQGGYMRSLHTTEELLYSPASPIDPTGRVVLYVRHNSVRWDSETAEVSFQEISRATGIEKRNVRRIIQKLETEGFIVVERQSQGQECIKNRIGLNTKFFGPLIEITGRPKFSVINGGKSEKLSTGGGCNDPTLGAKQPSPQGHCSPHRQGQDQPPEPQPGDLKNPSKELSKKLSREKVDKNNWNSVREYLLTEFPNDAARLDGTYQQIKERGYEQESKVPFYPNNLSAWLLVAYKGIRHDYAHHDRRRAQ